MCVMPSPPIIIKFIDGSRFSIFSLCLALSLSLSLDISLLRYFPRQRWKFIISHKTHMLTLTHTHDADTRSLRNVDFLLIFFFFVRLSCENCVHRDGTHKIAKYSSCTYSRLCATAYFAFATIYYIYLFISCLLAGRFVLTLIFICTSTTYLHILRQVPACIQHTLLFSDHHYRLNRRMRLFSCWLCLLTGGHRRCHDYQLYNVGYMLYYPHVIYASICMFLSYFYFKLFFLAFVVVSDQIDVVIRILAYVSYFCWW